MASFTYGLAKGLKEPCSPYRQTYVFGAELNTPNADGWNCLPTLWDPTSNYDLSTLSMNREILVALLVLQGASGGVYNFSFRWYRERDNKLLFSFSWGGYVPEFGGIYSYSYIGYVDWEIIENGSYYVDMQVDGPDSRTSRQYFNITGIPAEPPPEPPPPEAFMAGIIGFLKEAQDTLIDAFTVVSGWISPFNLLATPLDWLQYCFGYLYYYFSYFSVWVSAITDKAAEILTSFDIFDLMRPWINAIASITQTIQRLPVYVLGWIDDWWQSTRDEVFAWINNLESWTIAQLNTVRDWVLVLISDVESWTASQIYSVRRSLLTVISNLETWTVTEINDFRSTILAAIGNIQQWTQTEINTIMALLSALIDWVALGAWITTWWNSRVADVMGLIDTAFALRESLWSGWQDIKDQVIEFFADPWDWLYNKLDDFIERHW